MLAGGAYVALDLLLFVPVPYYRLTVAGAILALVGGYLTAVFPPFATAFPPAFHTPPQAPWRLLTAARNRA
jgi:hypothetical protein